MTDGGSTAAYSASQAVATDASSTAFTGLARSWWNNPYLLGSLALGVTAVLTLCFSLLFICHKLHHIHYCSLFFVEMAVGSLTTEAIVNLLPALVLADKPTRATGMPRYFPHLATVTFGVCLLHTLDTASVVFFGRRQSTSHAMEWRFEANHHTEVSLRSTIDGTNMSELDTAQEEGGPDDSEPRSVKFSEEGDSQHRDITLRDAVRNPRLCLRPGPYRLCSIMSVGSILHSFADGVAIGAAFVKSWESGLHLSLSVGMHELAHKVADFAVLTASGFPLPALLLLNCCYCVAAFVGLFISVPLSQKSDLLRVWIMTIVTAMFVYVSLVTMSSLVRKNYLPQHIRAFLIGNAGMTTGYILIMVASVLEFFH